MKHAVLSLALLALWGTSAEAGTCRFKDTPPAGGTGNITMLCEDEAVRDNSGKLIFRPVVGQVSPTAMVEALQLSWTDASGSKRLLGPAQLTAPKSLSDVAKLTPQELFAAINYADQAPADLSSVKLGDLEFVGMGIPFATSNCRYVTKEVRTANLRRFITDVNTCTSTGGCIPNEIKLCIARIACSGDALYGTTEYSTVCRTTNGDCTSVDECIRDDAVMTDQEASDLQKYLAPAASATAAGT